MNDPFASAGTRRLVLALLVGGLLLLAYAVLQLFLVPVAWAAIMAYTTWPLHARLRRALGGRATLSATLMTLLLSAAFVLPVLWLVAMLRTELANAYAAVEAYLAHGPRPLPDFVKAIPWAGERLQQLLDELARDPHALRQHIGEWVQQSSGELLDTLGGVGRNAAKLGFALVTLLFLYRDGESLLAQLRQVLRHLAGPGVERYVDAVGQTTKAIVYGLVFAALAQGLLAGLGYWAAGVEAPVLLAVMTALVALIPWGTPLVWAPLAAWLLITGHTAAGVGLLLWGMLAVSWIDNLLRPLVISNAAHVPFLLVMFGVIGGAAAFGLIGLFVGPVILAVMMAVWREWVGQQGSTGQAR
ncbi:MAG: AI-2E family transporter [Pseudomonadota bacterium]